MLRFVGLGAIMTLLSASIAFNWFGYTGIDGFHVLIAYAASTFSASRIQPCWCWE